MDKLNPRKTDISQRYLVVIGAFLTLTSLGVVVASFGVFFKPLSNEFSWTRGDTSGAFSTAIVISGLMAVVSGRLADRFSPRLIIMICGALLGCACLLLSRMNAIWQLYLYFGILVGCGMSSMVPTTSLIARIYKRRRGLMTGIAQSGASIGSVGAAPFITLLIAHLSWRTSFIILGLVILVIVAISSILLRDPVKRSTANLLEDSSAETGKPQGFGSILLKAIGSRPFWILGTTLFCVAFAQGVMIVHIIPHATDIGISPIAAAAILSVVNITSAAGNFIAGRANDIIGGRLSMIMCLAIIVMGMIVLLIAGSVWVFYVAAILVGVGIGGAVILRSTIVAELFGLRSHGAITGAIMAISTIGGAIGPLIAGYIFDISNQYQTSFIITMGICLIGLALACLLKIKFASIK